MLKDTNSLDGAHMRQFSGWLSLLMEMETSTPLKAVKSVQNKSENIHKFCMNK